MMSSQERTEHRDKMLNMKTCAECKAYIDGHRKTMEARAKEKGVAMPAGPRSNMCERMKQRGRIS
jgi:ribosomal protein L32